MLIKHQSKIVVMNPDEESPISTKSFTKVNNDDTQFNEIKDYPADVGSKITLPERQEKTRSDLATFLIWTFAGTIGFSFVLVISLVIASVLIDEKKSTSFDKTGALVKDLIALILTAETGLIGTALGFYFGSKGND